MSRQQIGVKNIFNLTVKRVTGPVIIWKFLRSKMSMLFKSKWEYYLSPLLSKGRGKNTEYIACSSSNLGAPA